MDIKKLDISLLLLISVIAFGSLGYHYFEDMTFFDAFYQTIITITTVGFSEIKPLSTEGRTITIFIIVTGIGSVTYSLGQLVGILVEGELGKFFGRKKLAKQIADLVGSAKLSVTNCRPITSILSLSKKTCQL